MLTMRSITFLLLLVPYLAIAQDLALVTDWSNDAWDINYAYKDHQVIFKDRDSLAFMDQFYGKKCEVAYYFTDYKLKTSKATFVDNPYDHETVFEDFQSINRFLAEKYGEPSSNERFGFVVEKRGMIAIGNNEQMFRYIARGEAELKTVWELEGARLTSVLSGGYLQLLHSIKFEKLE